MAVTPKDVLTDPKFQALSLEQRRQAMSRIDPNFGRLSPDQQNTVLAFKSRQPEWGEIWARRHHVPLEAYYTLRHVAPEVLMQQVKSITDVTSPNVIYQMIKARRGDKAAQEALKKVPGEAGQLFAMSALGGLEAEGMPKAAKVAAPEKAGSIIGAATRAKAALNYVEDTFGQRGVGHENAMNYANKMVELGKQGYSVPKPVSDFIAWVEEKSKPPLEEAAGGARVEGAPPIEPLDLKTARNFYTALGESIPWDQFGGKGGRMFRLAKGMRAALGRDIEYSLEPTGAAPIYRRGLADWEKAMNWQRKAWKAGGLMGKVATYGSGVPHPWVFGSMGAKAGESVVGSMVRSITEARQPEPMTEFIRRTEGSGVTRMALREEIANLETQLKRQPDMFKLVQLRMAQDKLARIEGGAE